MAGTLALVVIGGTVAYANVNKSVTLDVDGKVSRAHTFSGSVQDFLADQHVKVGPHDTVSASGGLHEGDQVVVRHGRLITVQVNGEEKQVWTTALSAADALDTLAARDGDVRLVASRSASDGRPELPLDLSLHGPAQIVVDGTTIDVPDADAKVAQVLDENHVTLNPLDRVSVVHADGHVQVVVNRVAVDQVTSTQPIAFETTQTQDASLLQGKQKVTTAGVAGERTVVTQVTTIDGQVTNQVEVSNEVTKQPVTQVVAVGTKAPVKAKAVAPKATAPAAPAAASTPAVGGGAAASLNWAALAACESGGRPTAVSSNGLYYGLYQFSLSTWRAMGGSGLPSQASPDEQTARAQALYNRSGAGQWPVCGKNLFR